MADRVDLTTYKAAPSRPLPGQLSMLPGVPPVPVPLKRKPKKPAAPAFRHRVLTK